MVGNRSIAEHLPGKSNDLGVGEVTYFVSSNVAFQDHNHSVDRGFSSQPVLEDKNSTGSKRGADRLQQGDPLIERNMVNHVGKDHQVK